MGRVGECRNNRTQIMMNFDRFEYIVILKNNDMIANNEN